MAPGLAPYRSMYEYLRYSLSHANVQDHVDALCIHAKTPQAPVHSCGQVPVLLQRPGHRALWPECMLSGLDDANVWSAACRKDEDQLPDRCITVVTSRWHAASLSRIIIVALTVRTSLSR